MGLMGGGVATRAIGTSSVVVVVGESSVRSMVGIAEGVVLGVP